MAEEPFAAVGRVVKTHGLKGEVSVISYSDASLDLLVGLDAWVVPPTPSLRQTKIVGVRSGPKGPIVTLAGVSDIDTAAALSGRELLVASAAIPDGWDAAEEDTVDGFEVFDEVRGSIGTVTETLVTGANDVWVVHGRFGEVLVPVIDEVVIGVDEDAGTIDVRLLDGLMD